MDRRPRLRWTAPNAEKKEERGMRLLKDFRSFILRGNVIDLAIAVVIGIAFAAVVTALVKDLLTPLISIPGKADFSSLTWTIHGSTFRYGDFLNVLLAFVLIAATVFFLVVKPINKLMERRKGSEDEDSPKRDCPECLSSIPAAAQRCAFCTASVQPTQPPHSPAAPSPNGPTEVTAR